MNFSDFASIATLALFIMYFLGRIWKIFKTKNLMLEEFDYENIDIDEDFAEDRENLYNVNNGGEIVSIKSKIPILWFKIQQIDYDLKGQEIVSGKKKIVVKHEGLIKAEEPIYLRLDIPEGFPKHRFVFQRYDYCIVTFNIAYNGRFGGMYPLDYRISFRLRSILYYLLK